MATVTNASFAGIQKLGRALMLPIAVMPLAALLLRLGQPDLLDVAFVAAAGDAIFANLGILFAIGVAVGFAKESHGAAALAGAVGFFVTIKAAAALVAVPPETIAGLADALATARAAAETTVVYVRTDPLVGVPGYESWWDVPVAETGGPASLEPIREAYRQARDDVRPYVRPTDPRV